MSITEIKAQVLKAGLSKEQVRLYGDLRFVETWEKALESVAVCLDIPGELEECEGKPLDQQPEVATPSENGCGEIIPFTHENNDLHLPPNRREIMLEEVARMRAVFTKNVEAIADCPPPPPPPVIIRPCPIPERRDIPGVEIAERESPSPGDGRDGRWRDSVTVKAAVMRQELKKIAPDDFPDLLGDLFTAKIKNDCILYLGELTKFVFDQFADKNTLTQYDYFDVWAEIDKNSPILLEINSIYEFLNKFTVLFTTIKQQNLPLVIHDDLPAPPVWLQLDCKPGEIFLILEKPAPIAFFAEWYDGVFIPNRYHGFGNDVYIAKFPTVEKASEFFENVTEVKTYMFLPSHIPTKQIALAGV